MKSVVYGSYNIQIKDILLPFYLLLVYNENILMIWEENKMSEKKKDYKKVSFSKDVANKPKKKQIASIVSRPKEQKHQERSD